MEVEINNEKGSVVIEMKPVNTSFAAEKGVSISQQINTESMNCKELMPISDVVLTKKTVPPSFVLSLPEYILTIRDNEEEKVFTKRLM